MAIYLQPSESVLILDSASLRRKNHCSSSCREKSSMVSNAIAIPAIGGTSITLHETSWLCEIGLDQFTLSSTFR
jgi:hypothetical protein